MPKSKHKRGKSSGSKKRSRVKSLQESCKLGGLDKKNLDSYKRKAVELGFFTKECANTIVDTFLLYIAGSDYGGSDFLSDLEKKVVSTVLLFLLFFGH